MNSKGDAPTGTATDRVPNRWVLGARPRTLPAAIAPVLVGTAVAAHRGGPQLVWWALVCAMGVALCVQIATNYANDYSDGTRGTDDPSQRVGPPRLVGNGLATPGEVKRAMLLAFAATVAFGIPLVLWVDWWLALVGVAAVAAGWFYTGGPRPYGYAGFGELFVFTFFGMVATVGSAYVQHRTVGVTAIAAGVMMGCWATALLVVNNLRDIPGDTASGKQTLAVRLGDRRTRFLYVAIMAVPYLCLPFVAGWDRRIGALAVVIGVPLSHRPVLAVLRGDRGAALIPVLVGTARVQMIAGAALALGLALT